MSTIAKFRINEHEPLWVIDMPEDVLDIFDGLQLKRTLSSKQPIQQLVFFPLSSGQLDAKFDTIISKLADTAVFWIAWPKKTGRISSDLARNETWERTLNSDWQGVSSISINDDWTGLRLKKKDPSASYKREVPMHERETEGIDYVNRTASLPQYVLKLVKPHKGLEEFFHSMSFTHKREYLEAIADAKKPETRLRRIEKMIEQLHKLRIEKELKKRP